MNGAYEVEEGDGGSRDPLLTGRKTYLVIDPHKPDSISRRPKLVHMFVKCTECSETFFVSHLCTSTNGVHLKGTFYSKLSVEEHLLFLLNFQKKEK